MIYIFLADGFEETEAITPIDYIRRCGLKALTVGIGAKTITGAHGISVECDITDSQTKTDGLSMVVLPGGMPGTLNLQKSKTVEKCLKYCFDNGRYIAAICAAPSILGGYGFLSGKNATCFPGFEDKLTGARLEASAAVTDGNIITAKGAGCANQFAFEIIKALCGAEKAEEISSCVQWQR